MDKGSHCLTQLGPPNPLEECMSQFSDTKVASQGCHIELLMKSSHNPPVLGTTIWSTPSELRCIIRSTPAWCFTQNCGSLDMQQSMHLHQFAPICIYAAWKIHKYKQLNMENIYIWLIYMFSRLHICIYALHIRIYGNKCPCTQSAILHIYIYIYIYIYICSARPNNTV